MQKIFFNWSTGKDSALALHYLLEGGQYDVAHLITSVNAHYDRVSMHGLRRALLDKQVEALGIPYSTIELPEMPSMEEYEVKMEEALQPLVDSGLTTTAFGDIFLEDLRKYREDQLEKMGIKAVFPLWKRNTLELAHEFIEKGFKATVVCAKAEYMDESFVGRDFDKSFLEALPPEVDPCGENGEFHTFCYDGPIFDQPISFEIGEKIYRAYKAPNNEQNAKDMGFWYCDLE